MRQNGFWKGFVSALVLVIGLYGVNAYAGGGKQGVTYIDPQIRMAEAMIQLTREVQEMNDKGLRVRLETEKPIKVDKMDIRIPEGMEVRSGAKPIEIKVAAPLTELATKRR